MAKSEWLHARLSTEEKTAFEALPLAQELGVSAYVRLLITREIYTQTLTIPRVKRKNNGKNHGENQDAGTGN